MEELAPAESGKVHDDEILGDEKLRKCPIEVFSPVHLVTHHGLLPMASDSQLGVLQVPLSFEILLRCLYFVDEKSHFGEILDEVASADPPSPKFGTSEILRGR